MNIAKLTAFLKQKVLPNLPYALIFWFFNKAGNAYRLAPGTDFLQKLTRSAVTLGTAMASPLPSMDVFDLAVGAAGTEIIYFIVWQKKRNARKWRKDVEYGSARWGTPEENEQNFSTVAEMIGSMEVREDDETFRNIVDLMFDALEEKDPEHFAVRQYRKFRLAAGKTLKSIIISCGARLAAFDIAEIREITRYDELELDTIGDEKTALFLIISDTDSSFNFLISMCYTQLFNILCEKADDFYRGRLPVHVRCLIDEAANIGQIPNLEKLMATIRSREISACLFLQAQSQLKALYKDSAQTIVGNCDSAIFLGGKEKETLEDWSKLLGRETIDTYSNSETKGNSPSFGKNYQKLGKELMSIDELAVMDGGMCVFQLRGVRPFFSRKFDITKHPRYKQLADYDKRNEFDIQKYLNTKLKLRANDSFEVFDNLVP